MRTLWIVTLVALAQIVMSFALIRADAGGGSFAGLGIMAMAIYGIPATVLVNALIMRGAGANPRSRWLRNVLLVSLILPAAQSGLLLAARVAESPRWAVGSAVGGRGLATMSLGQAAGPLGEWCVSRQAHCVHAGS